MNFYDPFNIIHGKKSYKAEPPGTIAYTGNYNDVDVEIECISYSEEEFSYEKISDFSGNYSDDKIYWFNVIGLSDIGLMKKIGQLFHISDLDLEDIVHVSQWSKIEVKDEYVFSIMKMIYMKEEQFIHEHISIIHKDNVLITFQETAGDVFGEIRDRIKDKKGIIRFKTSDYLFYALIDALVDQYFHIISNISDDFRELEIKILENDLKSKAKIYELRKELLYLVNAIAPIKDSVEKMLNFQNQDIKEEMSSYYADLIEHLNLVYDSLKSYKEMMNSLHEMHMSNVSNDMNKIMMTLTIFSAIFIPLSFLAGVFGMNFSYIPGLDIKAAFYIFISLCVIIAGGMLLYFKSKKWY